MIITIINNATPVESQLLPPSAPAIPTNRFSSIAPTPTTPTSFIIEPIIPTIAPVPKSLPPSGSGSLSVISESNSLFTTSDSLGNTVVTSTFIPRQTVVVVDKVYKPSDDGASLSMGNVLDNKLFGVAISLIVSFTNLMMN
ncbi:9478_t:CDS:1 [Funneliformis geosporum]|uniref:9478_t:CDS:1 n=1 Tax=Funneliformis geosporum TaxID=1117311 RepID=A0A9W4SBW2_9GLOM|nr:9478_t:CDS:1 [Funneliformis geosporum]